VPLPAYSFPAGTDDEAIRQQILDDLQAWGYETGVSRASE